MAELMPMIHQERQQAFEVLESLASDQWQAKTACDRWTVQQVAGHLVGAALITVPHFMKNFLASGFNFDKTIQKDVDKYSAGTPTEVLSRFKSIINSNRNPPGPAYVGLGEIMVHSEDIYRAVGVSRPHAAEHLAALAPMYVKTGKPLNGKVRAAGLKLRATDIDWTHGEGPEVAGPAISLILAITGRKGAIADLSGDGVETLRAR